jgi:hypothetical protein
MDCEEARFAFLDGKPTPEVEEHMRTCEGCTFFLDMRKGLATASVGQRSGVFDSLSSLLGNTKEGRLLHWRLDKRIGLGGQGIVFRAIDCRPENEGSVVALKLARFSAERIPRIAREVAIAHKVTHTNICRVHSYDVHGDLALIVMEHVEGGSLKQKLKTPLPLDEALRLFRGICDGVQAMHDAGVLHLDLKPENVLLRDGAQPAVADFGMSVEMGQGRIGGTRGYQPPEQLEGGKVDQRTDVFALGKLLEKMVLDPPLRIAQIIERATAPKPEDRYPTVAALRAAIEPPRKLLVPRNIALAAGAVPLVLLLVYLLVPVERTWNVARNTERTGTPRLTSTSQALLATSDEPWDLFDGVVTRGTGIAFAEPCGGHWLVIDLGGAYRIDSVRVYVDGEAPAELQLDAEVPVGSLRWTRIAASTVRDGSLVTARFEPVVTQQVRIGLDTCASPTHIVEVQTFSTLSRWQSWKRWFAE